MSDGRSGEFQNQLRPTHHQPPTMNMDRATGHMTGYNAKRVKNYYYTIIDAAFVIISDPSNTKFQFFFINQDV